MMSFRIGYGIDFHRLITGRDLWIGGVLIPHYKGALGHSDPYYAAIALCRRGRLDDAGGIAFRPIEQSGA